MLNARVQRNPIYLCQKNLGRMESQNHKITNITREKRESIFTLYISIITYGINIIIIYRLSFSLEIGCDFCDFCDEVSQRDRREHCKSAKNAHFIENFELPPPMPPLKKIAFFARRSAEYGLFFVNLRAKY